jgi:RPA family protein
MNTLKTIYDKIGAKTELAKHEVNLGLVQDITKDLNVVADSLTSIRPTFLKIEDLLIKNSKIVDTALKAVQKIETTAKELGADSLMKELDKPKMLINEFNKTIKDTLKSLQDAIGNL